MNITKEHLKLLKRMHVEWGHCEYGAPAINPKRPYGNGGVETDICEILGKKRVQVDYEEGFLTEDLEYASKIHAEMEDVLQICLCTGKFEEGEYEKECKYDSISWKKITT